MNESTTISTSTNWTASTETTWIHINPLTGTAGTNINVDVDPACLGDEAVGSITIQTDTDKINKTIKRCLPEITGENQRIEFTVKYDNVENFSDGGYFSAFTDVSACNSGNVAKHPYVIASSITEYTVDQPAGCGSPSETITLNPSEINVWYIYDGGRSNYITTNHEKTRDITIRVELRDNPSIFKERYFFQYGLKNDAGYYQLDNPYLFIQTGYTNDTLSYEGFGISGALFNQHSDSCEGGVYEHPFVYVGKKIKNYGSISGITACGEYMPNLVSIQPTINNIPANEVTFSVDPTNLSTYFEQDTTDKTKWYLHYETNESSLSEKELNISAVLTKSDGSTPVTANTKFFIVKSGTGGVVCGNPIYIHISSDKTYIDYYGDTATISYYISNTEEDIESEAIRDTELLNSLSLPCIQGVRCENETVSNGIKKKVITFGQNTKDDGATGINWVFTATCTIPGVNSASVSIYQANKYENIIPNCDYFVFRYVWTEQDGKDLDSLTHITNCPNLVNQSNKNVSGFTVGYGGTATGTPQKEVKNKNGLLLLKHGGDNMCSGAEGAIISLKNILKSPGISIEDEVHVDIYANWWGNRGVGSMKIEYDQFTGATQDGTYETEINEVDHDDCGDYHYKTFEPVPDACYKIGETVTTPTITVKAVGKNNYILAKNVEGCLPAGAYTHVLRLSYNIAAKLTSLSYFQDNGVDTTNYKVYGMLNGEQVLLEHENKTAPSTGKNYSFSNVYLKLEFGARVTSNYLYDDDGESIVVYTQDGRGAQYVRTSIPASKLNTDVECGFINNFKVVNNADKTINITFTLPECTDKRRKVEISFGFLPYGILNCTPYENSYRSYVIYQNYNSES